MKSLLAIVLIGILSFFSDKNETNGLVLEELEINMVNLDYESELEMVDINSSDNFFLQNHFCDVYGNEETNELKAIELEIPNYEYLEELESVEFGS